MSPQSPYHRTSDLPNIVPIFPLAGALLLPRGRLPLNIFEPRYLNMVDDALSTDRVIAMIQPKSPPDDPHAPSLYPVGCLGRLTSYTETGDGRYLINLTGLCRFRVAEETVCTTPYRQVAPNYISYAEDLRPPQKESGIDRDHLIEHLKTYLAAQDLGTDWDLIEKTSEVDLVTLLAMTCPFGPKEKQALLEAPTPSERAHVLTTLLEMASAGGSDTDDKPIQ